MVRRDFHFSVLEKARKWFQNITRTAFLVTAAAAALPEPAVTKRGPAPRRQLGWKKVRGGGGVMAAKTRGSPTAAKQSRSAGPKPKRCSKFNSSSEQILSFFLCDAGAGLKVESGSLWLTLEKQKLLKLQVHTQVHGSPSGKRQIPRGCSATSRERGSRDPLHFSLCTMTALRRLACCSVLLSSDSSLLGKVVIRTKSAAAIEGWVAITKCRRSDTLKDTRNTHTRRVLRLYSRFFSFPASSCCLIPPTRPLFLPRSDKREGNDEK